MVKVTTKKNKKEIKEMNIFKGFKKEDIKFFKYKIKKLKKEDENYKREKENYPLNKKEKINDLYIQIYFYRKVIKNLRKERKKDLKLIRQQEYFIEDLQKSI